MQGGPYESIVLLAGMPTGSHKKRRTTFCGKLEGELPLPVRSFKDPPILSEIISSDLDESQKSIFSSKKAYFRRSAEDWHSIGIPVLGDAKPISDSISR